MDEFKLESKKKISQLSKGQMSMVTILIALASRAPITILDEPAAGLSHRLVSAHLLGRQHLKAVAHPVHHFLMSGHIAELADKLLRLRVLQDAALIQNDDPLKAMGKSFRFLFRFVWINLSAILGFAAIIIRCLAPKDSPRFRLLVHRANA